MQMQQHLQINSKFKKLNHYKIFTNPHSLSISDKRSYLQINVLFQYSMF